jgi:hypothetical protein
MLAVALSAAARRGVTGSGELVEQFLPVCG